MTLKVQKNITLVNKCGAIYDDKLLIDAMLWYSDKPLLSVKSVSLHGRYPCISIGKKKIHIHRLIGMYKIRQKDLESSVHFHHINGDRLDNRVNNIEMIDACSHLSRHNKGKTPSQRCIEATIQSNKLRKGTRMKPHRPDITPQMVYNLRKEGLSFNKIAQLLKMDYGCVKKRFEDAIHDNPELIKEESK